MYKTKHEINLIRNLQLKSAVNWTFWCTTMSTKKEMRTILNPIDSSMAPVKGEINTKKIIKQCGIENKTKYFRILEDQSD